MGWLGLEMSCFFRFNYQMTFFCLFFKKTYVPNIPNPTSSCDMSILYSWPWELALRLALGQNATPESGD